jgi:hypothetical protein
MILLYIVPVLSDILLEKTALFNSAVFFLENGLKKSRKLTKILLTRFLKGCIMGSTRLRRV